MICVHRNKGNVTLTPCATLWLIDVFSVVIRPQWRSMVQRKKMYQALSHTVNTCRKVKYINWQMFLNARACSHWLCFSILLFRNPKMNEDFFLFSLSCLLCPVVPQVVKSCAEFIEKQGVVDGIYRLSGISSNIQKLRFVSVFLLRYFDIEWNYEPK